MIPRFTLDAARRNLIRHIRVHDRRLADRIIVDRPLSEDDERRARELQVQLDRLQVNPRNR